LRSVRRRKRCPGLKDKPSNDKNTSARGRAPQGAVQRCNRPLRPPRRLFGAALRFGNSAKMALRSSNDIFDQRLISSIERAQPVHSRVSGCTTQICVQGDWTSSRFQTSLLIVLSVPQVRHAIQGSLKNIGCRYMVDHLGATFSRRIRL